MKLSKAKFQKRNNGIGCINCACCRLFKGSRIWSRDSIIESQLEMHAHDEGEAQYLPTSQVSGQNQVEEDDLAPREGFNPNGQTVVVKGCHYRAESNFPRLESGAEFRFDRSSWKKRTVRMFLNKKRFQMKMQFHTFLIFLYRQNG